MFRDLGQEKNQAALYRVCRLLRILRQVSLLETFPEERTPKGESCVLVARLILRCHLYTRMCIMATNNAVLCIHLHHLAIIFHKLPHNCNSCLLEETYATCKHYIAASFAPCHDVRAPGTYS